MALHHHRQQQQDHPPPYYPSSDPSHGPLKLPALSHLAGAAPPLEPLPSLVQKSPASRHLASPNFSPADGVSRSASHSLRTSSANALPPLNMSSSSPSHDPARLATPTDAVHALTMDDFSRNRDVSVSMDDPDDRMAAEALCGLGKIDSNRSSARSPSGYETPLKYYPIEHTRSHDEPEPLLSLLTSSHPWLGGTINNSLSAYSSTKSHSPRFIQYGANFVERKIGSPMANTVGTVGRKTGVESGLRRLLGSRGTSELDRIDPEILDQQGTASKRRRISSENDEMDSELRGVHRTLSGHASIDTLPVYDENRSPTYEDSEKQQQESLAASSTSTAATTKRPPVARSWSTQLMISTSGLGAALNEPSLRSLKYCLSILRSANSHVTNLMEALKKLLSDFNNATARSRNSAHRLEEGHSGSEGEMQLDSQQNDDTMTKRIQQLNNEIWQTFKNVVTAVSRYTGGALPENASVVVRWQLMSVPRRWQRAVSTSSANSNSVDSVGGSSVTGSEKDATPEQEAVSNAHRMLAFAIEGIDMMEQVGGVVDSTILSAERWLDSLGRKSKQEGSDADAKINADTEAAARSEITGDAGSDIHMGDASSHQRPQQGEEMLIDTAT